MPINRRMDKEVVVHIYTKEYYSAIKKNEIMPLAATWVDLEIITLSEVSQTEKDKYHMVSLICRIWEKKKKDTNDAGEIQKRIQLLAHHCLPASDAVNSPKARFASVPGWYEVLTGTFTTLGVTRDERQQKCWDQ